jgi:hypothetical protein
MNTQFQHFVPRVYLKNFSFDIKRVWVFDKVLFKDFTTSIKKVAGAFDFYEKYEENKSSSIEKMFSKMENEWAFYINDITVVRQK